MELGKIDRAHVPGDSVWAKLIQVEGPGIRTAIAVVFPLIVGQVFGRPLDGTIIGLGGLYTSLVDRNSPPVRALLAAIALTSLAMFSGTLAANSTWAATTLMFCVAFVGAMFALRGENAGQTIGIYTSLRRGIVYHHEYRTHRS